MIGEAIDCRLCDEVPDPGNTPPAANRHEK
jgi:hypothetical protein